jgi:hypothetical protein
MSTNEEENGKESKEPDYDEDENQLEEGQEEETGELANKKNELSFLNSMGCYLFYCLV